VQIYLVNLASRPDRLAFMTDQLNALGLPFTRVDAINGLGADDIGYPADHPRLSKGEFACYLSHKKVWKLFLESGTERCLVLEDDVLLSNSLPEILAHEAFYEHKGAVTRLETRIYKSRLSIFTRHRFKKRKLGRLLAYDGGTAALVLTRKYVEYLLEHHSVPEVPVDDVTLNPVETAFRPHVVYQMDPGAAIQRHFLVTDDPEHNTESDLEEMRGVPLSKKEAIGFGQKIKLQLRRRARNFHHNTLTTVKLIPFRKD